MMPEDLIDILAQVNADSEYDPSLTFLSRKKPASPLMIKELVDLLCHVNSQEAANAEIQWDTIHDVIHRSTQSDDVPIDQLEFPDDDSTTSSLSMGSLYT